MKNKILIVGSGLYGCTFATIWKRMHPDFMIHMIEQRDTPGGNIATYKYNNIDIHAFGPHIFHTSDEEVWEFINEFDKMMPYVQNTLAKDYVGNIYHLPFNMNTFKEIYGTIYPSDAKEKIENDKIKYDYIDNLEQQAISLVGKTIYNKLIKNYTEKQWGRSCTELDKNIIKRLPVRYEYNNNYFNDIYCAIPKNGYSAVINNMISRSVDHIEYNKIADKEYIDNKYNEYDFIIYCGAIDEFFNYSLGELDWRSLLFTNYIINKKDTQGCAIMNDVSKENKWTRTIEHQYFMTWDTSISNNQYDDILKTYEFPIEYHKGLERYYPINNTDNQILYDKYCDKLYDTYNNVYLGGRIGLYKYLDMDDTIRLAIDHAKELNKKYFC